MKLRGFCFDKEKNHTIDTCLIEKQQYHYFSDTFFSSSAHSLSLGYVRWKFNKNNRNHGRVQIKPSKPPVLRVSTRLVSFVIQTRK
jgi:hypothetical protein